MAEEYVTRDELGGLHERLTGIVDSLNEVNAKGRKYVDEANGEQDKAIAALEKKLVESCDKSLQNLDKSLRKFISQEADRVAKSLKK